MTLARLSAAFLLLPLAFAHGQWAAPPDDGDRDYDYWKESE